MNLKDFLETASPLPWSVVGQHKTELLSGEGTPEAIIVVDTRFFEQQTNPREKEDALLIAQAVNLFPRLVAILEEYLTHPSTDGKLVRRPLREKLKLLLEEANDLKKS